MKIQVFSDIHFEGYHNPEAVWRFIEPQAEVAVIAGDIDSKKFELTLSTIASKFEHVIALYGNHEFYGDDISWRHDPSRLAPNVHVLNRGVFELDDVVFIGATLWSDFKNRDWFVMHAAKDLINDFHVIRSSRGSKPFTPAMAADLHEKDKSYIKMMIEKYRHQDKKVVIATHFIPSYALVHPRWKQESTDTINYYFSAQCEDLIEFSEADLWVFGHTHDRVDMTIYNTRCVCNPMGYAGERSSFDAMIIDLEDPK